MPVCVRASCCVTAEMHELAESGGAAHAAYKGGLDALQANRLQAWTRTLRALAPALSSPPVQPHEWSNQAAAAEQLFRCGMTMSPSCVRPDAVYFEVVC